MYSRFILLMTSFFLDIIQFIPGIRNPKLLFNNYLYIMEKKRPGKTMWRCSWYTKSCRARIVSQQNNLVIFQEYHNHKPPDVKCNANNIQQIVNVIRKADNKPLGKSFSTNFTFYQQ